MEQNETNFEVNLLPVISLLAVCISFLLLTAVWLPIGTLDVKQAKGETSENKEQPSRFAIQVSPNNQFYITVEEKGQSVAKKKITDQSDNQEQVSEYMSALIEKYPEISMAFIAPSGKAKYQKVVKLLENLKKLELKEIGIEPSL